MPTPEKKKSKKQRRDEQKKADKAITVELDNGLLTNAFGEPFMLQNFTQDPQLIADLQSGSVLLLGPDDDEPDDADQEFIYRDDDRLKPVLHADLSFAIQSFLRSRDNKTNQTGSFESQGDSDHVWDIGERLQAVEDGEDGKENGKVVLSKSDHRWLVQKAKDHAFEIFPIDARMFIDHLDVDGNKPADDKDPPADPPDDDK